MLEQPMIEKLLNMRLQGIADGLKAQEQDPGARELSFVDRLSLLVDQQWNWRENQALARRLKSATLRHNACVEDIDYRAARGLEKSVIRGWTRTGRTCSSSSPAPMHHSENLLTALKYARQVFRFRMFAAKNSQNRSSAFAEPINRVGGLDPPVAQVTGALVGDGCEQRVTGPADSVSVNAVSRLMAS